MSDFKLEFESELVTKLRTTQDVELWPGLMSEAADRIEALEKEIHAAGSKVMPREPTEEMLKSGVAAWHKSPDEAGGNSTWLADAYRAMWDAAP